MQLEDYFKLLTPNAIRLKDSRIGIETILYEYIYRTCTPEEIGWLIQDLRSHTTYRGKGALCCANTPYT